MKKSYLVFCVLIAVSGIRAQTTPHAFWEAQHPLPQGNNLRAVQMFDSANYIMCGDIGTVVSTTDDGTTWKVQAKIGGFSKSFNALAFNSRADGVTVGASGVIFYTADSGKTWKKAASLNTSALNGVAYATPSVVVAVGQSGTIVRSVDSGKTWKDVVMEASDHIRSVTFVSADSGYAVGANGFMYPTIDSGKTWGRRSFPFINGFFDVSFHANKREVALAGELGGVFLSHDGGANFTQQKNVSPWGSVNAIKQLSPTTIVAACDFRAIYVTTNSGADWRNLMPYSTEHLKGLSFSDEKQGVVVGNGGVILRTYDAGMTWVAVFNRVAVDKNSLRGIAAINDNTVVACGGEGLIIKSDNGGKSWRVIPSGTFEMLRAIHFASPKVGTIVGDSGTVLRTQNGGDSWYRLQTGIGSSLYAVHFLDTANGMAVGTDGAILRTQTGGKTWNKINYGDTLFFFGVSYNTKDNVVIVGARQDFDGRTPLLLVSDNGGFTFVMAKHNIDSIMIKAGAVVRSVSFPTPNVGYAAVSLGTTTETLTNIAKTTDAGHTWVNSVTGNFTSEVNALSFKRPDFGTAVGVKGRTWHTSNGGKKWDSVETNTTLDLFAVNHASLEFAWTGGVKTIVLRLTTDDVEQPGDVRSPAPVARRAEMLSNYPNPLGESGTTFSVKLPEASHVILRMYSATGAEMENIYDGYFPQGEHTIGWQPGDIAAGIYFAIIEACGKREMVKLVVK